MNLHITVLKGCKKKHCYMNQMLNLMGLSSLLKWTLFVGGGGGDDKTQLLKWSRYRTRNTLQLIQTSKVIVSRKESVGKESLTVSIARPCSMDFSGRLEAWWYSKTSLLVRYES